MNRFAALLDRLAYEPSRNGKLRLMIEYFSRTPDPERGYALAAITGALSFQPRQARHHPRADRRARRSGAVRAVVGLCRRLVGDGCADVAGTPAARTTKHPDFVRRRRRPCLARQVRTPGAARRWLDALDETGRWALLKLVTGALAHWRLGTACQDRGGGPWWQRTPDEIELVWPGLSRPTRSCSPGSKAVPTSRSPRPGAVPPGDAQPRDRKSQIFAALDPADFMAEWKWDGIRVQAVAGKAEPVSDGRAALFAHGRGNLRRFPDLAEALRFNGAIDGELLILRDGRVQSFNVLQQRLNRKTVTRSCWRNFPRICAPTIFSPKATRTCAACRSRDAARGWRGWSRGSMTRASISRRSPVRDLGRADSRARRSGCRRRGRGCRAVEGVMIKRLDALYLPGRPKGLLVEMEARPA